MSIRPLVAVAGALALAASACAELDQLDDDAVTGEVADESAALAARPAALDGIIAGPGCPDWACSEQKTTPGISLFELNLDGEANEEGFVVTSFKVGPRPLKVFRDRIRFADDNKDVPTADLLNAELELVRDGVEYHVTFEAVGRTTDWYHQPPVRFVPLYRLKYTSSGPSSGYVCQGYELTPEWQGIDAEQAILFAGDRYNFHDMTATPTAVDGRWFNVACAGSTRAQLHLLRHTTISSAGNFITDAGQRQAMFKMLNANYCGDRDGDGDVMRFTMPGTSVSYTDANGWHPIGTALPLIESIWNQDGAVCMSRPRLFDLPLPQPPGHPPITDQIETECNMPDRALPACDMTVDWRTQGHVLSATRLLSL